MALQIQTMPVLSYCELVYSPYKPFTSLHPKVCTALFLEAGWGSSSVRHFWISVALCTELSHLLGGITWFVCCSKALT